MEKAPRLGVGVAMAGPGPLLAAGHRIPMLPFEAMGRPVPPVGRLCPQHPAPWVPHVPAAHIRCIACKSTECSKNDPYGSLPT